MIALLIALSIRSNVTERRNGIWDEAKGRKAGIWASEFQVPWEWRKGI